MYIDVNVSAGSWPFQIFCDETLQELADSQAEEGIGTSLVSHAGAILYPDPDVYNRKLLQEAEGIPSVVPVMVINPLLTGWEETLDEYAKLIPLKAVKIYPNYHCYSLKSGAVNRLVRYLQEKNIRLVIQMRVDDERNQYSRMRVPGVPLKQIIDLSRRFPGFQFACLNPYKKEAFTLAAETEYVLFDISFIELLDTMSALLKSVPAERILFGTHTPFLYTRSNFLKLSKARIPDREKALIAEGNARHFFGLQV